MHKQGVTDPVSLNSSFDSDFINEFNSVENALNVELDYIMPKPPKLLHASASNLGYSNPGMIFNKSVTPDFTDEQSDSDSIESVKPPHARSMQIEDPIETYDSIVDEMKSTGVQWVPSDQMDKSLSEVRLAAPCGQQPQFGTIATVPAKTTPELVTSSMNGHHPSNEMPSFQKSVPNSNDQSTSDSMLKLEELQNQLNQEKATRKQQEDYIQQLQHYYDSLLAKHAAAEMTIDHFRFRSQVDAKDLSQTKNPPPATKASTLTTLRGRKLISASLDTCSPSPLVPKTNHCQSHITTSLTTLRGDLPVSVMKRQTNLQSPRVHLMSLSSALHDPLESDRPIASPKPVVAAAGEDSISYSPGSSNGSGRDFRMGNCRQQRSDIATQDAARSLESQLNASLDTIHDRLNTIETCLSNDKNEALSAVRCELEDLRRRYQAGLYLWSGSGVFDTKTEVESRLTYLAQRLERVTHKEQQDTSIPARPSSLSFVDSQRAESSRTPSAPMTNGPQTSDRHGNSSSPASVFNIAVDTFTGSGTGSIPTSGDGSLESAEAFFLRLLARYNKLKIVPNHGKDVESLMQRMLQLSDRYSAQSTVIFPPKSLRKMFESDYNVNSGAIEPLVADQQVFSQPLSTKLISDAPTKSHQMVSPDSGVPQTPLGSSGSSGNSCCGNTLPSRINPANIPSSHPISAAADNSIVDQHRKQSDSGFWATDSHSTAPAPPFKDTTIPSASSFANDEIDELEIDPIASHPSKMLPNEVMSLEADIRRLRQGIARLNSASIFGPRHRYARMKSDSSASTCEEQPRRKSPRRQTLGRKPSTLDPPSKRSSATRRQPRLPSSTSSSDDEAHYAPYRRSRCFQSSRNRNCQLTNSGAPLEVIGSAITPTFRPVLPRAGQTRTYRRNSSASRGREDYSIGSDVSHRRSHSTIGRAGSYYRPCGSCGGSGFNINSLGRESEEEYAFEAPLHYHARSDTYPMPSRVIYEYGQTPTIRLPMHNEYSGWTERCYGMKEIYGSSVSPQTNRAYNTIGHQPSTQVSSRGWLNMNQFSWDSIEPQPALLSAKSVVPQRVSRRTRQYVPSVGSNRAIYHSYHEDMSPSDSDDRLPGRDVTVLPTSKSFCNHRSRHRHRSSSQRMATKLKDSSSATNGSIDAFSAARSVTQMAHQLNNKLSRHQDFGECLPQRQ